MSKGMFVNIAEFADGCYESSVNPMVQIARMKADGRWVDNPDGTVTIHSWGIISTDKETK